MKWALKIWFIITPFVFPTLLEAWGYDGHRRINYLASMQLKGPFGQFLKNNSDPLKWYAVAPDYNKDIDPNEFHRHFIDTDYYDDYPFSKIPKEYEKLVEQYGEENIRNLINMYHSLDDAGMQQMMKMVVNFSQSTDLATSFVSVGVLHALGENEGVAEAYRWANTQEDAQRIISHFDIGKSVADYFSTS